MNTRGCLVVLLTLLVACATPTRVPQNLGDPGAGPEQVVRELYERVTFGPGTTPDWDAVRALFLDEAVVVLRTSRAELTVFSREGFVDDFKTFIATSNVRDTGFTERILDLRVTRFGDIAQVMVRFDSHIPGSGRPPGEGIDSFELVRRDGRWRIVSIVNERSAPDHPIPDDLFGA